jgi:hypothetical protein
MAAASLVGLPIAPVDCRELADPATDRHTGPTTAGSLGRHPVGDTSRDGKPACGRVCGGTRAAACAAGNGEPVRTTIRSRGEIGGRRLSIPHRGMRRPPGSDWPCGADPCEIIVSAWHRPACPPGVAVGKGGPKAPVRRSTARTRAKRSWLRHVVLGVVPADEDARSLRPPTPHLLPLALDDRVGDSLGSELLVRVVEVGSAQPRDLPLAHSAPKVPARRPARLARRDQPELIDGQDGAAGAAGLGGRLGHGRFVTFVSA